MTLGVTDSSAARLATVYALLSGCEVGLGGDDRAQLSGGLRAGGQRVEQRHGDRW